MKFLTMDFETIPTNKEKKHYVHLITLCDGKDTFVFTNYSLLKSMDKNIKLSLTEKDLFKRFFKFLNTYSKEGYLYKIYVHNLGGFDGLFLLRNLINCGLYKPKNIKLMIDKQHYYIRINLNNIEFLDSTRLFARLSLKDSCSVWNVKQGKLESNPLWFTRDVVYNETEYQKLIAYAKRDVECLYECIKNASKFYNDNYELDFFKMFSAAGISYNIWKQRYNNDEHATGVLDSIIRESYFGGYTNCFKLFGQNLKIADVNSLYPSVMLNEVPIELLDVPAGMEICS